MDVKININLFHSRLKTLISEWKTSVKKDGPAGVFQGAEALVIAVGRPDEEHVYQKSTAIQAWLLGYEFSDTIMVLVKDKLVIMTGPKKADLLSPLKNETDIHNCQIEFIIKNKEDSLSSKLEELVDAIKENKGKKVGHLPKDVFDGETYSEWKKIFESSGFELFDMTSALSEILSIKDDDAMGNIRLAAEASSLVMKNLFVFRLETIMDEEQKVTHSKLSEEIESCISDSKNIRKLKLPQLIKADSLDWCYAPILQSGGNYDLRPSAASDNNQLTFDVIICSLGVRYQSFCSNISRTYLVSPQKEQEENYKFLIEVQKVAISALREGNTLSKVYEDCVAFIEKKKPELLPFFTKNCGFGMGIEFRESAFIINQKNKREIQNRMLFNIAVGFENIVIKGEDGKEKKYSLFLADTVEVTAGNAKILTKHPNTLNDITYYLDNEEKPEEEKKTEKRETRNDAVAKKPKAVIEGRTRQDEQTSATKEEQRREHQRKLFESRMSEGKVRFGANDRKSANAQTTVKKIESYKNPNLLPPEVQKGRIYIDTKRDTVILPICGFVVPFHISTIKNHSFTPIADKDDFAYLRINFITPGQGGKDSAVAQANPDSSFIREVTYRSREPGYLDDISKGIKELKKLAQERETKLKEQEDLVAQDELQTIKNPPTLPNVMIRPTIDGKRATGNVEIHSNGIRFRNASGKKLDILFSNVKHLFFQPCEKEVIVLIHLHLKHPIIVDKKKAKDVQFYREVLEANFDETGGKRKNAYGDRDEIDEEQEERRRRRRQDKEFLEFAKKIEAGGVMLDTPFRDLGFYGVPFRSSVLMQPTPYALVHLTDSPFYVVTLEEIELAHFERIEHGLKNFDIVFVFKDFKKQPSHINSISMQQLEQIKDWLDESDIPFTEGKNNLNWTNIMKHINEDPQKFFEEGGWSFLLPDGEEEEEESESGSEFEPSGSESESYSESSSEGSEEDSDFSEGSELETPDESSGDDWDELEEKAAADDKKRAREEVEEVDERKSKKPRPSEVKKRK